jgi:hypothetical protein
LFSAIEVFFWLSSILKSVVRELIFDPEIEKTTKANRKAARLARLAEKELTESSTGATSDTGSQSEEHKYGRRSTTTTAT